MEPWEQALEQRRDHGNVDSETDDNAVRLCTGRAYKGSTYMYGIPESAESSWGAAAPLRAARSRLEDLVPAQVPTFVAPTQVWSDPTIRIGQNVVRSLGRGCKRTMPSRKGWVTGLPEELWVCAAAEVTRRRPAAAPERARYMASQASHELPRPQ